MTEAACFGTSVRANVANAWDLFAYLQSDGPPK
jgi:hypothetical protein